VIDLELSTQRRIEALDITEVVAGRQLADGVHLLSTPHTTASLFLSEVDKELLTDLERTASELLRPLEPFTHARENNPNAAAHLFSSLAGTQLLVEVEGGNLQLGRYQRIVFLELDGPRSRRLRLQQLTGLSFETR
jgi:secondary thiamine-phosphate synthase enzyme